MCRSNPLLLSPKACHRVPNNLPVDPIMSQINPLHICLCSSLNISFIPVFTKTLTSPNCCLLIRVSYSYFMRVYCSLTCYMSPPPHLNTHSSSPYSTYYEFLCYATLNILKYESSKFLSILLWAGSRAARGKMTINGTHDRFSYFVVFITYKQLIMGRDSSVGIATRYGLDGLGIESQWGRDFPYPSRPALGPTQPPVQLVTGLSRG